MKVMTLDVIIANEIKYLIESENLKYGDKLPSERELSERFKVQRLTLRSGLEMLEHEGLIYSRPRVGYFVNKKRIEKVVNKITAISDHISTNYESFNVKLIKLSEMEVDKYLNQEMNLPLGTRLYEIKRLRIIDGEPVSVDYSFIPKEIAPGLDQFDFEKVSLYDVLINDYNLKLSRSSQKIIVIEAEANYLDLLRLEKGSHVVLQSGAIYDSQEKLIEFCESYMKYDRYAYVTLAD